MYSHSRARAHDDKIRFVNYISNAFELIIPWQQESRLKKKNDAFFVASSHSTRAQNVFRRRCQLPYPLSFIRWACVHLNRLLPRVPHTQRLCILCEFREIRESFSHTGGGCERSMIARHIDFASIFPFSASTVPRKIDANLSLKRRLFNFSPTNLERGQRKV